MKWFNCCLVAVNCYCYSKEGAVACNFEGKTASRLPILLREHIELRIDDFWDLDANTVFFITFIGYFSMLSLSVEGNGCV